MPTLYCTRHLTLYAPCHRTSTPLCEIRQHSARTLDNLKGQGQGTRASPDTPAHRVQRHLAARDPSGKSNPAAAASAQGDRREQPGRIRLGESVQAGSDSARASRQDQTRPEHPGKIKLGESVQARSDSARASRQDQTRRERPGRIRQSAAALPEQFSSGRLAASRATAEGHGDLAEESQSRADAGFATSTAVV